MKKLVLSFSALCMAVSLNAQQNYVNGNFEAAMSVVGGGALVNTHSTSGWGVIINGGPEASAYEGSQALKLVTATDATLNGALTWGDDIITGYATQSYKGAFTNVTDITVSFAYKATPAGGDKPFIQVAVYDTLAAGASDDVALYFDNMEVTAAVASWTPVTFTMTATGNTGTPNRMVFLAVSSQKGFFDTQTPTPGSTLWLDDVVIGPSLAGIEDVATLNANVYPNPASDVLNVNTNVEAVAVSVISMDGKVVATQEMNGTSAIVNVADLNAGAYFYEVKTVDGLVSRNTFMKK